jgi:hypothetical protein
MGIDVDRQKGMRTTHARPESLQDDVTSELSLYTEFYVWRSWPLWVLVLVLVQVLAPLADLSAGGGEGANCALESDAGGDGRGGWEGGAGGSEEE